MTRTPQQTFQVALTLTLTRKNMYYHVLWVSKYCITNLLSVLKCYIYTNYSKSTPKKLPSSKMQSTVTSETCHGIVTRRTGPVLTMTLTLTTQTRGSHRMIPRNPLPRVPSTTQMRQVRIRQISDYQSKLAWSKWSNSIIILNY